MEKIENVDLGSLVTEASVELIADKRKKAAGLIKKHLEKTDQLASDVRKAEKELKSKQEKLTKAQATIAKIKAGDWSLLAEKKDGQKKCDENKDNNY